MHWHVIDLSKSLDDISEYESLLDQLIAIYRREGWWNECADNRQNLLQLIRNSHIFAAVLTEDGQVLGMGRAISDRTSDAYIQDVAVRVDFRNSGIGKALVSFLVEELRRSGMTWIGLISQNHSYPFYRKLGFNPMKAVAMTLP